MSYMCTQCLDPIQLEKTALVYLWSDDSARFWAADQLACTVSARCDTKSQSKLAAFTASLFNFTDYVFLRFT